MEFNLALLSTQESHTKLELTVIIIMNNYVGLFLSTRPNSEHINSRLERKTESSPPLVPAIVVFGVEAIPLDIFPSLLILYLKYLHLMFVLNLSLY